MPALEIVREVAVFLIVVNILSSLMPEDIYKKYLKMLSGIILILIIIQPLHVLFNESELKDMVERQIKESNIVELNKSLSGINEEIGKSAKKVYEDEIKNSIFEFLNKNGIQTDEIKVELEVCGDELVISEIVIEMDENRLADENGEIKENYASETRNLYVKNLIAGTYGIDKDLILVR